MCLSLGLAYAENDYFGADKEATGLLGFLYDLKNDSEDNPSEALGGRSDTRKYYKELERLLENGLKDEDLNQYKIADTSCNFEYMAVSKSPADLAPAAFGSPSIEPKGILIVYSGVIEEAPEEEFRFAGHFDDALMVLVNGEVVFYNAFQDFNKYKPVQASSSGVLGDAFGKFITLKKGDKVKVAFAEIPGGSIRGALKVELKKFNYKENRHGAPVIHPFVAREVDRKLEKEMEERGMEFEDRRIPEFIFVK